MDDKTDKTKIFKIHFFQEMDDRAMQLRSRMRVDGAISSYDGGTARYAAGTGHNVALGQAGNTYGRGMDHRIDLFIFSTLGKTN